MVKNVILLLQLALTFQQPTFLFLIFFLFKRLCAQYPRLRAVSLFSWSVEQNARDTQMTTRVPVSWPFNMCDAGDELVIVLLLCYFMLRSLV